MGKAFSLTSVQKNLSSVISSASLATHLDDSYHWFLQQALNIVHTSTVLYINLEETAVKCRIKLLKTQGGSILIQLYTIIWFARSWFNVLQQM